jgi:transcriptional regulator of acetoin/glycerol metabolism
LGFTGDLASQADVLEPAPEGRDLPDPNPALPAGMDLSPSEVAERARIRSALEEVKYRREEAASLLGISRTTLWRKMKEYRI